MGTEIDRLEIAIESSSEKTVESLNKLVATLEGLKKTTAGITGLTKITGFLTKLHAVAQGDGDGSSKIVKYTKALEGLRNLGTISLGPVVGQLSKLPAITSSINSADLATFSMKTKSLREALKPLESLPKTNLPSAINALSKIGQINDALGKTNMTEFAGRIREVTAAIQPLAIEMEKVSAGFRAFPTRIQRIIEQNGALSVSNRSLNRSYGALGLGISAFKLKLVAYYAIARRALSAIGGIIQSSTGYVEDVNLFTVAMGKYADEAFRFSQSVQEAMGIDQSAWLRSQGTIMQIARGFGIVEEKAYSMSKNLTQLGYDISSFYNISADQAMEKLQSGITGQIMPLRELGYAIENATLQEVAYQHGIKQKVSTMTQAQKAQLRYVAIMQQSTQVMGDMARTINTPANAIRVFQQSLQQLSRSIGNMFIPVLTAAIPYVIAFVNVLTMAAQALAALFGFKLPTIDYSGITDTGAAVGDLEGGLGGAADKAKELKGTLASFDQLHVIQGLDTPSGGGGGSGGAGGGDLGLDMSQWDYDFLSGINDKVKEITESILDFVKPIGEFVDKYQSVIKGFLAALVTYKVAEWLWGLVGALGSLTTGQKFALGLAGLAFEIVTVYDAVRRYSLGEISEFDAVVQMIIGAIGGFALLKFAGVSTGLALVASSITLFGAAIAGLNAADAEKLKAVFESITFASQPNFPSISGFLTTLTELTREYSAQAKQINEWGRAIDVNKDKIDSLSVNIQTLESTMGSTGPVTKEEVDKMISYFNDLHEAISENLTLSSNIITTAISGALKNASEDIKPYYEGLLAEHLLYVKKIQGEQAATQAELNNAILDLEGLTRGTTEFDAQMAKVRDLAASMDLFSATMTEAKWKWEDYLSSFRRGEIDLGGSSEALRENTEKVKEYSAGLLTELRQSRDNTAREYDEMIRLAQKRGDDYMVTVYKELKDFSLANIGSQIAEVETGVTTMLNATQAQMVTGIGTIIDEAKGKYKNMEGPLKWYWEALGGEAAYVSSRVDDYKKTTLEPLMALLENQFKEMGIEGSTWAAEAFDVISSTLIHFGTSELTPQVSKALISEFERIGADVGLVAHAIGLNIPMAMSDGIASNLKVIASEADNSIRLITDTMDTTISNVTPSLIKDLEDMGFLIPQTIKDAVDYDAWKISSAIDSIMPEAQKALQALGYDLDTTASQEMLSVISTMVEKLATGQLEIPKGVSDIKPFLTTALQNLGLGLKPDAIAAIVEVLTAMQNTWQNTGLNLNKSETATVTVYTTLKEIATYSSSGAKHGQVVTPYASGATNVPRGDLFIANEEGAELVGRIGNNTGVANQEQIGDAIFRYMDAHGGASGGDDAEKIAAAVKKSVTELVGSMVVMVGENEFGRVAVRAVNAVHRMAGQSLLEL